ncbi:hypothetical protein HDU90_002596 [Geranomyces variabilis]|nr:hypothetical protein HDU90_002596 [Geranomyces variabilis]
MALSGFLSMKLSVQRRTPFVRNKEVRIHEEFWKIVLSRRTLQGYQAATYEPKTSDVSSSQDLGPILQETITEVSDEEDEPGDDASDANVVDTLAAGNADAADDESDNDMITQGWCNLLRSLLVLVRLLQFKFLLLYLCFHDGSQRTKDDSARSRT